MKKKFSLSILAACLLTTSVLAACGGGKGKDTSNPQSTEVPSTSAVPTSNSSTLSGQGVTTSSHTPATSAPSSSSSKTTSQPSSSSSKSSSTSQTTPFSFTVSLSSGSTTLNKGEEARIIINETGGEPGAARRYTYRSANTELVTVYDGTVTAIAKTDSPVRITVTERNSGEMAFLAITVIDATRADGAYNFASLYGQEAINTRTEILGDLEKYAMDNHLTGITMFENGGYVKYHSRVTLPTTTYITGYGFGLLSEGSLDGELAAEGNANHKMYLHTATSQDPKKINARNDSGSQVSDLEGYITSSFWGTKLNEKRTGYEWYPVLAKDTVTFDGKTTPFTRPLPVFQNQLVKPGEEPNPTGLYSTWRIYVKTGSALKYRYQGNSWGVDFDGREVSINDYEFAYRFLLTASHNFSRGAESAGDETYGIIGANKYYLETRGDVTDEFARNKWNEMKASGKLGIKTGNDSNGDYIQLTILNPIDRFTAMYTLSSSLASPIPEAFISTIGSGSVKLGAERYGTFVNAENAPAGHVDNIVDYVISVGPYMLEGWVKDQAIIYKKNNLWNEPGRYNIAGVKIRIIDTSSNSNKIYERFELGELDSTGIPIKYISKEVGQPRVYKTRGDATFKLNVNSCTQEMWDYLFGPKGKIKKGMNWDVKPWMSNDNFLNGLFYSIDRNEFATNRGVQPSINYFSDAYLSDPERGVSYNDTDAHKNAVSAYQVYDSDGKSTYGYSYDRAVNYFKAAVDELLDQGKIEKGTDTSHPYEIHIHIRWMYNTDIDDYGDSIATYFTRAFNNSKVSNGLVKLVVDQEAVSDWQQVYKTWMMQGQFDLGFGAISGNTYNPLNFLEVLKSDNSSTFTLNWGTDTSKVTPAKPLIYDDKIWSFDSLWAVADHGGIVRDGEIAKTIEKCYLEYDKGVNNFAEGLNFKVITQFINSEFAQVELTRIQVFVYNAGGFDLEFTPSSSGNVITASINMSRDLAQEIQDEMRRINHMDDQDKYPTLWNTNPFTLANYNQLWAIEISYSLATRTDASAAFGIPTESYYPAAMNIGEVDE